MKLGTPTSDIPPHVVSTRSKYAGIYEAIKELKGNDWLPVEFESERDAYNFRVAASVYRRMKLEMRLRGNSVFVRQERRKPAKNGSKNEKR